MTVEYRVSHVQSRGYSKWVSIQILLLSFYCILVSFARFGGMSWCLANTHLLPYLPSSWSLTLLCCMGQAMSVHGLVEVRRATRASWSALSFPGIPECPGTQARVTGLSEAKLFKAWIQSQICFDSTLGLFNALSTAWHYSIYLLIHWLQWFSGMWYSAILQESQPERLLLLNSVIYFCPQ